MGHYRLFFFPGDLSVIKRSILHFELFLTQDLMGLDISTLPLVQFSSDLTQTLSGHWLAWGTDCYDFGN